MTSAPLEAGPNLDMSAAISPSARSIDFHDEDPDDVPSHLNIVLWDGAHRLPKRR